MLFLYPQVSKCTKLLVLLLFSSQVLFAQNLDSLLTVARSIPDDSAKIRMFNKVAFGYIFSNSDKAIEIINEGQQLAKEAGFNFGITELTNTKGIYMDVTGKSDSANFYFSKALNLSKQYRFRNIEVMCTNNLGMFNWNRGNFEEALNYFFESLKMNDEFGEEKTRHIYLNNIGLIYQEMLLSEKALEYHQDAYDLRVKYNYLKEQAASLNNIGICLKELNRLDEAEAAFHKGLKIAETSNNLRDYFLILDNLGNVYQLQDKPQHAISTYLKALDKPEELGSNQKSELITYSNIIRAYNKLNQPNKSQHYSNKGLDILKEFPHYENDSEDFFLHSAETQYMLRNFAKARSYTEKFVSIKDSIFSENNAKAVAALEIKYETEKKEKQLLVQRAELAEQDLTIQRRNYQLLGIVALTIILGILGYLLYNQQKLKNKQLQKENELKDALLKIETQNKLQEQRLRISRDLHDNIGAQLTFIISSIDNLKYGFDIKDQKLTAKLNRISNFTTDTIYELRDTIWAMNKSEITLEDLKTRITNYIDKAEIASSQTSFQFNVANNNTEYKSFSSIEGMNIYRIIQEAINNAVKYAKANKIVVDIEKLNANIQIKVSDNGKGFDVKTIERGNGLYNMEKRAQELGANFKIDSNLDKGTTILLIF